jgi:hypothetical protein
LSSSNGTHASLSADALHVSSNWKNKKTIKNTWKYFLYKQISFSKEKLPKDW